MAVTRQRCRRFCHSGSVGRLTSSAFSVCICDWKKRESPSLFEDGKVIRCTSETMCHLWQFIKNVVYPMTLRKRRATNCKFQVSDDQETSREKFFNPMSQSRHRTSDCMSLVSRHWETSRRRFQNGFSLSLKASLVNPPRLTRRRGGATCR